MADKQEIPSVKLHGVVDKILPPLLDDESEKAQIVIHEAEDLYKEIRIDNSLQDGGEKVKLKRGTQVEVTIKAPHDGIHKGSDGSEKKSA